ncbi:IS110 family transposase, partial [Paenibacillaceae bacterium]
MNCTRNEIENQRIERITTEHVVVGIDIAKEKHAAQVTDYRGRVLTKRALSFSNTVEGYEILRHWIQEVLAKQNKDQVLVGLEPTGHYWHNLANWLLDMDIEVVLVNPVTTHRNKENRDNSPSKNDPKDALVIADVVTRGYYTDYAPHQPGFEQIKSIISEREFWANDHSALRNRIVRWIDIYFPEFTKVFKEWDGVRALATLRAFPLPMDLKQLQVEEVIEGWIAQGMKRASGRSGRAKAAALLRTAARSVGRCPVAGEARRELMRLLEAYTGVQQ